MKEMETADLKSEHKSHLTLWRLLAQPHVMHPALFPRSEMRALMVSCGQGLEQGLDPSASHWWAGPPCHFPIRALGRFAGK
jgi:hypothetical protein